MSLLSSINTVIVTISAVVTAFTPVMLAIINREQKQASRLAAEKAEIVRATLQAQTATTEDKLNEIRKLLAEKINLA